MKAKPEKENVKEIATGMTLADISIASPFATLDHAGTCIDGGRNPKLKAYVEAILARPSFAQWIGREKAFLLAAA